MQCQFLLFFLAIYKYQKVQGAILLLKSYNVSPSLFRVGGGMPRETELPDIKAFFDESTFSVCYVVSDPQSAKCAVIDPVLGFDPISGRTSDHQLRLIEEYIRSCGFSLQWLLETHVHADHLSGAAVLKQRLGGAAAIGDQVCVVQQAFAALFDCEASFSCDGGQFDLLLTGGQVLELGNLSIEVLHTPGHTPACVSYRIADSVFVGDTLFMPDYGTARCDFPGGDAEQLYHSITKLLSLPEQTKMFCCHDYKAPGRDRFAWETTVQAQRENVHLKHCDNAAKFSEWRQKRDKQLSLPKLMIPAVQVNIRAGQFPPSADNGRHYLKLPIDSL